LHRYLYHHYRIKLSEQLKWNWNKTLFQFYFNCANSLRRFQSTVLPKRLCRRRSWRTGRSIGLDLSPNCQYRGWHGYSRTPNQISVLTTTLQTDSQTHVYSRSDFEASDYTGLIDHIATNPCKLAYLAMWKRWYKVVDVVS